MTRRRLLPLLMTATMLLATCGGSGGDGGGDAGGEAGPTLTIYSGRSEELVRPVIEQFQDETGIRVQVRYGATAEMAGAILEEGDNSPADVFFAQDAGALGALSSEGRFAQLPTGVLDQVDPQFRSVNGDWVGVSGRARVAVYNTAALNESALPDSILGFTADRWKGGKIGWAPTNGSFQAFVTALRVTEGEDGARAWLEGIQANEPKVYENNIAIVEAAGAGEIQAGFVNHYYLHRVKAENPDFPAANHLFPNGDVGSLVNVAGVGVLEGSDQPEEARQLVEFLLSEPAQQYFSAETFEIPLVDGVAADPSLPPLETLQQPDIDLAQLSDLEGTLRLLTEVGVI
ncbi:MAG TPA: iron ABC transporter substrate-binding protein [Acidimicrobiales bacterium]|nr:iron ABC transporter substrate-binding protein [Acidimicrobiales bacterium]